MSAGLASLVVLAIAAAPPAPAPLCAAAKEDLQAGRSEDALDGFTRCLAAADEAGDEPTRWQALIGQGLAHEQLGRLGEALNRFAEFFAAAPADRIAADAVWRQRREVLEADVARLEPRVLEDAARLGLDSAPGGARVVVSRLGAPTAALARTPEVLYLPPGTWRVRVEHPGFIPFETHLTLAAGDRHERLVTLASAPPPAVSAPEAPIAEPEARAEPPVTVVHTQPPSRTGPSLAFGTGVALLAAGGVFTALTAADVSELERLAVQPPTAPVLAREATLRARAPDREATSWVFYGLGAAALLTGAALLLWGPDDSAVGVTPGVDGATASARLRF